MLNTLDVLTAYLYNHPGTRIEIASEPLEGRVEEATIIVKVERDGEGLSTVLSTVHTCVTRPIGDARAPIGVEQGLDRIAEYIARGTLKE